MLVSVAEWSKALVLGTSLPGGAGSNPAAAKSYFMEYNTLIQRQTKVPIEDENADSFKTLQ